MTDFVLEQAMSTKTILNRFMEVQNYANFLKQPLELWMFVPCDENGNVLEAPECYGKKYTDDIPEKELILHEEFVQAKERCLFEGFEVIDNNHFNSYDKSISSEGGNIAFRTKNNGNWVFVMGVKIIEDLVKYNLQLTPTAQKQIGCAP
jgi:hypothetical protein